MSTHCHPRQPSWWTSRTRAIRLVMRDILWMVPAVAIVACSDHGTPPGPIDARPALSSSPPVSSRQDLICIDVCFLAPTPGINPPDPLATRAFDASQQVKLLVCELADDECTYRPALRTTLVGTRIEVNPMAEYYFVRFDVSRFSFDPAKIYRIQNFYDGRERASIDTRVPDPGGSLEVRFRIETT
jgi:hypothetical protein